jgi:hypothetical protein
MPDNGPHDDPTTPAELLERVRREVTPGPEENRFIPLIASGDLPRQRLADLAGEEHRIIASDLVSFGYLAARFAGSAATPFFTGLADGERAAQDLLLTLAAALGAGEAELEAYEPRPGCQAYPSCVASLALSAPAAEVAVALVANFDAWGGYCAAVSQALRDHPEYGVDEQARGFFDFFATPVPEVEAEVLAVVQESIDAGQAPGFTSTLRHARLLQAYELMFWNTLADDSRAAGLP